MMFHSEDLLNKLREVEQLIRENTNPDGSCKFDPLPVFTGLELARRMITPEEKTDNS